MIMKKANKYIHKYAMLLADAVLSAVNNIKTQKAEHNNITVHKQNY